jgi:hypothetical protein
VPVRAAGVLAALFALAVPAASPAWADDDEDEEDEGDDDDDEDRGGGSKAAPAAKGKSAAPDDDDGDGGPVLRRKQNLTGHDLGTTKRINEFERDRFFVDKVDTEETEDGTLVQGSLSTSTFVYKEAGGKYDQGLNLGENAGPARLFAEMRLQTDFRHIKGSRWDARIDARARMVNTPANDINRMPGLTNPDGSPLTPTPTNNIQSGLFGKNEYELREMWMIRSGDQSDVYIGRQFATDLGAVKFDGVRVDYAKTENLTIIGFGGLFPLRGSRSLTTDYIELRDENDGSSAGRFVLTGGGGGAYRTHNAYGAVGLVTMYPLKKEPPRIFAAANGYYRYGSKLDIYHFGIIDFIGPNGFAFTNLSAGVNGKPNARLRLTASVHRVDTETLDVQAGAFLSGIDRTPGGNQVIQNEAFIVRLATNQARAGVSAGLGKNQRFELSTALSFRQRPEFTLTSPDPMMPVVARIPAAQSAEVWGSLVDRTSFRDTRIALEASRTFRVGQLAFQRSEMLLVRAYASRMLAEGRGEWEAEVSYSSVKDSVLDPMGGLGCTTVADCYGTSNNTLMSAGGQLFYRLRRDWFGIGTLHLLRITNRRSDGLVDPVVYGITGWLRVAKRF